MKIEAIIVCAGYADFLEQTLPHNLRHFDHMLVVSSYEDKQTQALCRDLSVECRCTDLLNKGGTFAKGRAIDWGLGYLEKRDWICHLDADIYLPPQTRRLIEASCPDQECIYGCDRFNLVGFDNWLKFIADPKQVLQFRQNCLLLPPPLAMGARIVLPEQEGYCPIGFFQLWHARHERRYPLKQTTCEHTDVLHALQWPRGKRHLLEEVFAIHLESEPSRMGANWSGRRTAPFAPRPKTRPDSPCLDQCVAPYSNNRAK